MKNIHGIEIEEYLKGEMNIHFSQIKLTQRSKENPILFFGPGRVHLDNGHLKYVIYHKCISDEMSRHLAMSLSEQPGELINEESLFDFEGVDISGKTWTAEEVDTSGGSYQINFCVIEGSIESLSSRRVISGEHKNTLHHFYFYNPHFPSSLFPKRPNLELAYRESIITIAKDDSRCYLCVQGGELSDDFSKAVEKALNVLSGVILQIGITEKIWDGHSTIELYSRQTGLSNQQLPPPIEIKFSPKHEPLEPIFNLLIEFLQNNGPTFYDNWNKLNRAWQAGIESAALNVSVCIEGILRSYFEPLGTDSDFAELSKRAVPAVMQLEIEDRVKTLLRSCLGGAGRFKPKTALRALTKFGKISPGLAEKWNKLRSETAHAVVAGESRKEWQRMVDLTFANIKLFYEILFSIVEYTGERIDYESRGFPSRTP